MTEQDFCNPGVRYAKSYFQDENNRSMLLCAYQKTEIRKQPGLIPGCFYNIITNFENLHDFKPTPTVTDHSTFRIKSQEVFDPASSNNLQLPRIQQQPTVTDHSTFRIKSQGGFGSYTTFDVWHCDGLKNEGNIFSSFIWKTKGFIRTQYSLRSMEGMWC